MGEHRDVSITELFIGEHTSSCCNIQFPKRHSVIARTRLDSDERVLLDMKVIGAPISLANGFLGTETYVKLILFRIIARDVFADQGESVGRLRGMDASELCLLTLGRGYSGLLQSWSCGILLALVFIPMVSVHLTPQPQTLLFPLTCKTH